MWELRSLPDQRGGQGDRLLSNLFIAVLTILLTYNYAEQTAMKKHMSKNRGFQQMLIPTIIMGVTAR